MAVLAAPGWLGQIAAFLNFVATASMGRASTPHLFTFLTLPNLLFLISLKFAPPFQFFVQKNNTPMKSNAVLIVVNYNIYVRIECLLDEI